MPETELNQRRRVKRMKKKKKSPATCDVQQVLILQPLRELHHWPVRHIAIGNLAHKHHLCAKLIMRATASNSPVIRRKACVRLSVLTAAAGSSSSSLHCKVSKFMSKAKKKVTKRLTQTLLRGTRNTSRGVRWAHISSKNNSAKSSSHRVISSISCSLCAAIRWYRFYQQFDVVTYKSDVSFYR